MALTMTGKQHNNLGFMLAQWKKKINTLVSILGQIV